MNKCHCGKNGHVVNSINCSVHGKVEVKAWADIGSHNKIFMFELGPVASKYPTLLHVYKNKITPDLVPVTISYGRSNRTKPA